MPITRLFFIALSSVLLSGQLQAQFQLNGSAVQLDSSCYRLTPSMPSQAGSMWSLELIDLNDDFDLSFEVMLGCIDFSGADGMYFAIQPISTSVGTLGGGIGFLGISPSIGVEFDTYTNGAYADPSADHMSIMRNGNINHSSVDNLAGPVNISSTSINVEDCIQHSIRITWNASAQTLEVYFDCVLRLSYTGDIVNNVFGGDPFVYYGFTSATGALYNNHEVCLTYITDLNQLEDQSLCDGDSVQLVLPEGFVTYEWSPIEGVSDPGASAPWFSPEVNTLYSVIMTDDCGYQIIDSAFLTVAETPVFELGPDQEICSDEMLILSPGIPAEAYLWQDGSMEDTLALNSTGLYWLTLSNGDCSYSDTLSVEVVPVPIIELGPDRSICAYESTFLDATFDGASYTWSSGEEGSVIEVSEPGFYIVELDNMGCLFEDSVEVILLPTPVVELGNDTTLCFLESIVLIAQNENATYQWQDLSSDPTLLVIGPGTYSVEVSIGSCIAEDEILIDFEECECSINFPNAFSPNSDGINDIFRQYGCNSVSDFLLQIFNRWGQKVYESRDPVSGWAGDFNGTQAELGTYVWQVRYSADNQPTAVKSGNVTLLR